MMAMWRKRMYAALDRGGAWVSIMPRRPRSVGLDVNFRPVGVIVRAANLQVSVWKSHAYIGDRALRRMRWLWGAPG